MTDPARRAVRTMPDRLWRPALDQDGTLRDSAEVGELTGMVELSGYPAGTHIIVRRERPHPGAQLSLFDQDQDQDQGLRHQVFLTDTPYSGGGSAQFPEVRHRGHAHRRGPHPVRQDHRLRPPKKLRYRLLHVAARLTRGGRSLRLRMSTTWPWRNELATAFHRLATLPRPAG